MLDRWETEGPEFAYSRDGFAAQEEQRRQSLGHSATGKGHPRRERDSRRIPHHTSPHESRNRQHIRRYARYPRVDFGEGGDRNSSIFQLIMNVIKFYIGNIRECYKALFVSVRLDTRQTQRRARTINPFPRLRHLIYRENLSSVKVSAIYFFDGGPYRRTPVFGGAPAGASACPLSLRARLSIREYPNPECVAKMFTSLEKVGILCITIVGFQITRFLLRVLYNNVIAVKLRINAVNLEEMGKWAVVTGATDGVGKAYSEVLAKKGFNIVLISRTQQKLDTVASEIESKYQVQTKTVAVDFTSSEDIYHAIEKQLFGIEVGILINNVGMSYPYPEYFLDVKDKDVVYRNIIKCNVESVTNMCKIVMPGMVERKRGVIVNVSSTASRIPSPLLTVYSASKAYIDKFSSDLQDEYRKFNIVIQCLVPGYVATKMSKIRSSTWMAPSPLTYVNDAIKTIGVQRHTTGYLPHSLLLGVVDILDAISPRLSRWLITRTMENIRARALRRNTY